MKLSDIYNSICIDSSVENKNCILLKIVFYLEVVFYLKVVAADTKHCQAFSNIRYFDHS